MLEMLKSAGDGVLLWPGEYLVIALCIQETYEASPAVRDDLPRCTDLMPLLSMLVFLSGSLFSARRASRLGRLDATEGFRVNSVRDALRGK